MQSFQTLITNAGFEGRNDFCTYFDIGNSTVSGWIKRGDIPVSIYIGLEAMAENKRLEAKLAEANAAFCYMAKALTA